eukprot:372504_1
MGTEQSDVYGAIISIWSELDQEEILYLSDFGFDTSSIAFFWEYGPTLQMLMRILIVGNMHDSQYPGLFIATCISYPRTDIIGIEQSEDERSESQINGSIDHQCGIIKG